MHERALSFGAYLRQLRTDRGITIKRLEQMTGISNGFLSLVENGKRNPPSPEILRKLHGPLGISYEELMVAAGYIQEKHLRNDFSRKPPFQPVDSNLALIPLYTKLNAFRPLEEQEPNGFVPLPTSLRGNNDRYLYIEVPDSALESMGIQQGDRVLVREQHVKSGDFALCVTESHFYIRRIFFLDGQVVLQSTGVEPPIICEPRNVTVLGKAVTVEMSL